MAKKLPNSVFTLILTSITVVSWVFYSIYQTFKKPLPVVVPPEIIQPVDPNVGLEVIEKIKNKKHFEEGGFKETIIKTPNPTPKEVSIQNTPTPKTETPSPTIEPVERNEITGEYEIDEE